MQEFSSGEAFVLSLFLFFCDNKLKAIVFRKDNVGE